MDALKKQSRSNDIRHEKLVLLLEAFIDWKWKNGKG
jgi:hypothetical protein